jgi:hypothetical protein
MGVDQTKSKAPAGATKKMNGFIFRPYRGLVVFCPVNPQLSPWTVFLRASGADDENENQIQCSFQIRK